MEAWMVSWTNIVAVEMRKGEDWNIFWKKMQIGNNGALEIEKKKVKRKFKDSFIQ